MFKVILCFFIFLSSYSFSENQECSSVFQNKKTLVNLILNKASIQDIQKAIEQGANVNAKSVPLKYAILWRNNDVVKLLLDHGANVNARDKFGRTTLSYAIRLGNLETIKLLLQAGASVNARDKYEGQTALMWAVWWRNVDMVKVDIVKLLVEYGANVNARDKIGSTALMLAAQERRTESVKLLLSYGADVNTKDQDGQTALSWAKKRSSESKKDYKTIIKILEKAGAQ